MNYWRNNARPRNRQYPHPYTTPKLIKKLEENLLIFSEEFVNMNKISKLFKELYQLDAKFDAADNVDRRHIRDEMQRIDEEILTLIKYVNAIQVKVKSGYRETICLHTISMSPIETVQHEIADITMWMNKITSQIEDLKKIKELSDQRHELHSQLRRMRLIPPEKLRICSEIANKNRDIKELRDICAHRDGYYQRDGHY